MHRITKLDPRKQCNEYVDERLIAILEEKIAAYHEMPTPTNYLKVLYNVPAGYELTARMARVLQMDWIASLFLWIVLKRR